MNRITFSFSVFSLLLTTSVQAQTASTRRPVESQNLDLLRKDVFGSVASEKALEDDAYLAAFDFLRKGRYDNAIIGFGAVLTRWPQGGFADSAWYWMGKAYFLRQDYPNALKSYQSLVRMFPASPEISNALFDTGTIYQAQQQSDSARSMFEQVITSYPSSNAAERARTRLAQLR